MAQNEHGLNKLILMDPLGPMTVPHDPIHVHILAKQEVHGKAFDDVLSTGHISGKGRVTSIHPSIHPSIYPSIHPS